MKVKYTKEILESAVKQSYSVTSVLRLLNLKTSGSSHRHISQRIKVYGINTDHFIKGSRDGKEILSDAGKIISAETLRKRLLSSGILYTCKECGVGANWNNKPLTLQVDHINGIRTDNKLENLRLLCPNCHTQTSNYGVKNAKFDFSPKNTCKSCEKTIKKSATYCRQCYYRDSNNHQRKTKIKWLPLDELNRRLETTSYEALGREFGVTGAAVKKHIRSCSSDV